MNKLIDSEPPRIRPVPHMKGNRQLGAFLPTTAAVGAAMRLPTSPPRAPERALRRSPGLGLRTLCPDDLRSSVSELGLTHCASPRTLYRHFPTRDALIEAVYRTEVEKLAAAERKFTETMSPIEALRAWMLLFVDHIAAKHIIAPALNTLVGGPSKLYEGSRRQIQGAIDALVKRAITSGDIRKDLDPFDLLRALIGVSNVATSPDWQQSARRLVDILITGSRPIK